MRHFPFKSNPARLAARLFGLVMLIPFGCVCFGQGLQKGSPWPKFQGNESNTGRAAELSATAGQKWSFAASGGFESTPVVGANGTVYAGTLMDAVELSWHAVMGGETISLRSSNPAVHVPPTVLIPETHSSAAFSITTLAVTTTTAVTLTATLGNVTKTTTLTVLP